MGGFTGDMTRESLIDSVAARRGHFVLESGHHGDLWLDLELLCLHPKRIEGAVTQISEQLRRCAVEAVCGPLNEGAFIALMVASQLDVEFSYAERLEHSERAGLFPVEYRVPAPLRRRIHGKRVAIVNDVINAGSAVRGTFTDIQACGAEPAALAALLVLGEAAARFAVDQGLELVQVAHLPNHIWTPAECPLCAAGIPLDRP